MPVATIFYHRREWFSNQWPCGLGLHHLHFNCEDMAIISLFSASVFDNSVVFRFVQFGVHHDHMHNSVVKTEAPIS